MSEPVTVSGRYKREHPDRAREYQRRDNAKRSKAKQEAWRGVCVDCGGETSRRNATRCRPCWRISKKGSPVGRLVMEPEPETWGRSKRAA